jgi:hypothetical protein
MTIFPQAWLSRWHKNIKGAALRSMQSLGDAPELVCDEHRTYTQAEADQLRREWALKYRHRNRPHREARAAA